MLVDDSAVIRGLLTRWIQEEPDIEVVASVANGAQAVRRVAKSEAEIVVLDIEMPEMDGLTALPEILKAAPGVQVIMASTLTRDSADVSLRALALGAADYLPKPGSVRAVTTGEGFRWELIEKLRALAKAKRKKKFPAPVTAKGRADQLRSPSVAPPPKKRARIVARAVGRPAAIGIGSSTGGPQALMKALTQLGTGLSVPVFVTQHMPPTFTAILAEHIQKIASCACAEAVDGEIVAPGRIYIAPGDFHMAVKKQNNEVRIRVYEGPQENFCRPAVDPLFRSLADVYGARLLAVVLTGMGHDGREGARQVVERGGAVIAQDEQSSVVWGMPGAVVEAGLAQTVLPLDGISVEIKKRLGGA
jgi:two-component system chemotaxis response regulator CheB